MGDVVRDDLDDDGEAGLAGGGDGLVAAAGEQALVIDCQGITDSDSAGLAVLLDWLAAAKAQGRSLRYAHLPQGFAALGRISEATGLLELAQRSVLGLM